MAGASSNQASLLARLEALPARVLARSEAVAANAVYTGTSLALAVVVYHYDGIDLPTVGEGFAAGQSAEELDSIEAMVALVAERLAAAVPVGTVLQAALEGEEAEE